MSATFPVQTQASAAASGTARRKRAGRLDESTVMWLSCVLILAVSWLALAVTGLQRARQDRREMASLAASTAKGFSEYVGLHLLITDRMLVNSRDSFARSGRVPPHEQLRAEFGQMGPMLLQVAIANAQGGIVASSLPLAPGMSIADRPHFLAFRNDPRDRLLVSQPVVGRVSGKMSLQLVRPLIGPGGEFRGVIVASIDPLALQQYFGSVDGFAADGAVMVMGRDDGIVRARFTRDAITWGQDVTSSPAWRRLSREVAGSYEGVSVIDGVRRMVGFHHVAGYPLVVAASSARIGWSLRDEALGVLFGAFFSLAMVAHTRARVRRLREQETVISRLEESSRREAEANRMKSNFLASVSHELRTPLNAILGFSELIRDVPSDAENAHYADLIHGSGEHLHALLNTLLDLAKIEAGRMEVQRSEVDLGETVAMLVDTHRNGAVRKGLAMALHDEIPTGSRALAETDRTKLVQVLNNVLHNAVKFTDTGDIRLTARVDDADEFTLVVRDSGRGIPADRLPHIFDRFSNVGADSQPGAGTGLGLALSRDLLQLLGGSICIASSPSGTEVTLRLPGVRLAKA
jgi:two-component system, NarL family, sensor histidine kinase BarA